MRNGSWSRRRRGLSLFACAWLTLFVSLTGAHVAAEDDALATRIGSRGHQPWHRHYLGAPAAGWSPGLDSCTVCLAHAGFRALEAGAESLHPAGTWRGTPVGTPAFRLLARSVSLPLSRAPPRI